MVQNKQILFRCSSIGGLLCEPKSKAAKEAGELGGTAKSLVQEVWLQNEFGYNEEVITDAMLKGLLCEQDSMALAQKVLGGEFRTRFNQRIQNEYVIGTPDVVLRQDDYVEDIKTSANLRTFLNADLTDLYHAQLQCYMWLTGKSNARLIYCLIPTPAEIILNEQKKLYYKFDCNEMNPDYIRMCEQIEKNNLLIDKLPIDKRVKKFEFKYDPAFIEKLKVQIEKARNYYNTLSL